MKKFMFGLVAVSSLVFGTGCGGDVCEDFADLPKALSDKTKNCPTANAIFSRVKVTDEQTAQCKEQVKSCSKSDKDKLNDALDCINDLPNCKSGEENAWAQKLQACAVKISTVNCD